MPDISIPQARRIVVDTTGAQIVQEESPAVGQPSRHEEMYL
jgi:type II pantothenate kinase